MTDPIHTYTGTCHCGTVDSVTVPVHQFNRWAARGELIQHVFPHLDDQQREIIISYRTGLYLCASCWDEMDSE